MSQTITNALVVGGGLAGLSAAIALSQAGIRVDLVEADANWQALGAGLSMNGASLAALGELGVLDQVVARGYCHDVRRLYEADGALAFESTGERIFGPDTPNGGAILRPVLHEIMEQRARSLGVTIQTDVRCEGAEDAEQGIVRLSTGVTAPYDLVVGADGFWSTLRTQLFPDAPPSRFTGQGCWRALAPRPPEITGACTFVGHQKVGVNPVSQTQMYLYLLQHMPEDIWIPESEWLDRLREQLNEFGGVIADVRAGLDETSLINYRPLKIHVLPAPWHVGRVLLIGDAAHATTPHAAYGAGLGFEDGIALGELAGQGLPRSEVLTRFMAQRFEKCRAVVLASAHIGDVEIRQGSIEEYRAAWDEVQLAIKRKT